MKIPGKKREFFFFLLKIGRVLVFALAIKLVSCRLQFLCDINSIPVLVVVSIYLIDQLLSLCLTHVKLTHIQP